MGVELTSCITNPGLTSRWPRTRPNHGLCTRQNAAPSLRFLKSAGFTTATSGAPPKRNSPRHNSYAGSVPILVARHGKTCS